MNAAKVYLNRLAVIKARIRQLEELQGDERLKATGNSSPRLDPNKVQTSGGGDVMARHVERAVDVEREIAKLNKQYKDELWRVVQEIQSLDNEKYVELLYLRYVKLNRLEEIACIMRKTNGSPYSYDHINRLHGQALEAFREKFCL